MKKLLLSKDKFFIFTLIINLCKYLIIYLEILYLIFDYPHKHYTFKYFEV